MKSFFDVFLSIFMAMAPYLLFGFIIAGALNELFKIRDFRKKIGKKNTKSAIYSSLLGVPLPLCSCGVIPTGISLYKSGASKGSAASFMISTPQTGVDSILVTWSLLGLPFAIIRPFIAFVTGVAGGMFTNFLTRKDPDESDETVSEKQQTEKTPFFYKVKSALRYSFVEFLDDISLWILMGLSIATIITVIIPEDFFTLYLGNRLLSMIVVLIAAIPLYVCATSSVPIAAALMLKGLSPGAALVFLMAGPATNAATVTVIWRTLGFKTLVSYLLSIISGALLFGFIIDAFLPASWFIPIDITNYHEHHGMLFHIISIGSSIILALLLLLSYFRMFKNRKKGKKCSAEGCSNCLEEGHIELTVEGMTCNHCATSIKNAIMDIPGTMEVEVNLQTKKVTVKSEKIDIELIKKAIESRGYKVI
jgi:uncharacterized protein